MQMLNLQSKLMFKAVSVSIVYKIPARKENETKR